MAQCRSCNAEIVWGTTRNGVAMPLDAEPTDEGNALLYDGGVIDVLGPLELSSHDRDAQPLRLPHHASCPDAEMWKRR